MSDEPAMPGRQANITLREITQENFRPVLGLTVAEQQQHFVATNLWSFAEAHFTPVAWPRAIYADEIPVGFVMLYDEPQEPVYYLWRFMIDQRYQGLGFGKQALQLVIDYVKSRPNAKELGVSCVPGGGSPCSFYEKLGFRYTGQEHHGELELKLALS